MTAVYNLKNYKLTFTSKALFRGLGPSLMRAFPAAASTFVAFELTKGELVWRLPSWTCPRSEACSEPQLQSSLTGHATNIADYILKHDLI